jgi:hypothetical protein
MTLSAADLISLGGSQLQEILGAFGFPNKIDRLVMMFCANPSVIRGMWVQSLFVGPASMQIIQRV